MKKKQQDALKYCRYYKGEEENPYEGTKGMLWWYECRWTEMMADDESSLQSALEDYIAYGLEDFLPDDGVPMSLKAILFNRYGRWSYSATIAVAEFKEWYPQWY